MRGGESSSDISESSHHRNDRNRRKSTYSCYKFQLELIDILISSFIIGPSVITYWRGTWNLCHRYLLPDNILHSAATSFAIGIIGHIVFTLFQRIIRETFDPDRNRLTFYLISRTYTYVFGVVCVNGWRGPWALTDYFTGFNIYVVAALTLLAIILLTTIKCLRNLLAPPFFIATDGHTDYFLVTSLFRTSGQDEPGLFFLDCMFSILVVGTLVVVAWRGTWVFLDLTLYAENLTYSAWCSLVAGYSIVLITYVIQPFVRWACNSTGGLWRITIADIFLFFSFIGTINVWRGIWTLLDIYFLPDNRVLSDWLTHGCPLILLTLLHCSNSILVRGVYVDGEEPGSKCIIPPIHYVRYFFRNQRTKKQKRLARNNDGNDDHEIIERRRRKQNRLADTLERQEQNNTIFLLDKSHVNSIRLNSTSDIAASVLSGSETTKSMLN